jgi:hypothetical protein
MSTIPVPSHTRIFRRSPRLDRKITVTPGGVSRGAETETQPTRLVLSFCFTTCGNRYFAGVLPHCLDDISKLVCHDFS